MILYLDLVSGIAGDMALGALVDLGVPIDWLKQKLAPILDGFELRTEVVFPSHLRAVSLHVDVTDNTAHRHYSDIRSMIETAQLPEPVKANCLTAFQKIAEAESRIHGQDIEHVHFHEIGGIDSLVDIIGTFLGLDYLGVTQVTASKIPLGSGTIECAHGIIPVPVPATIAILKGLPVTQSDAKTEIVTPTGAAIVATLVKEFGSVPEMQISGVGYGAGKRKTGASAPNILRMVLGRPDDSEPQTTDSNIDQDRVMVIHTNLDDTTPEILGFAMDRLIKNGALDVSFAPVFMKKNRPGTRLEVICYEQNLEKLAEVILTQTSAIGVRYHACDRMILKRASIEIETGLGKILAKQITAPSGDIKIVPEYEACKRLALDHDIPVQAVYDKVTAAANLLDRDRGRIIQNHGGENLKKVAGNTNGR